MSASLLCGITALALLVLAGAPRRQRRASLLALACCIAALVAATPAGAGPGWGQQGLPGIALGIDEMHAATSVTHEEEIYAAVAVGHVVVVRRYDLELRVWLPVGGPISRDADASAQDPVLLSDHGRLFLAYTEERRGRAPEIVVVQLVEGAELVGWRSVGPSLPGESPSLVPIDGRLWVVWREGNETFRLARLEAAGNWRRSATVLGAGALGPPRAIGYRGAIYVLYRARRVWNRSVGGMRTGGPLVTGGALVQRVDVEGDPDAPARLVTALGDLQEDVGFAQLVVHPGGRPLLAVRTTVGHDPPAGFRPRVNVAELSLSGRRFRPRGSLPTDNSGFLAAAVHRDLFFGTLRRVGPAAEVVLQRLHYEPSGERVELEDVAALPTEFVHVLALPSGEALLLRWWDGLRADLLYPRALPPSRR